MNLLALLALCLGLAQAPAETADGHGTLIVLNKGAATADLIDPRTGEVLRTIKTGAGPHEVAVSPDGKLAVVANYGSGRAGESLTVIDLETDEPATRVRLGRYRRPHGLWFAGPRLLLVTAEAQKSLIAVDLDSGEVVHSVETGQEAAHMVVASPDKKRAYVANIASNSMTVVDLESWTVLKTVTTGAGSEGIDVTPDGKEIWVANRADDTVAIVDAESLEVVARLECKGFPIRVKFTPDGKRALVSNPHAGDVAVFDVAERKLEQRVPMEFDLADGAEEGLFGTRFGKSPTPIGILIRPDGREAYVANAAADRIAVFDLVSLEVTRSFATGREPDGLAWF